MDPAEAPGRYLQDESGAWSIVGPDGWPIPLDEYADLHADAMAALAAVAFPVVDAEPDSVRDIELRKELGR